MYFDENQATIKYAAELKTEGKGYRVMILKSQETEESKISDVFASIHVAIDQSIMAETQFKISDSKLSQGNERSR